MLSRLPSPHCRGWHTFKGRGAREESREVSDPRTRVSTNVVVSVPKPCSQVRGVKREAQTRHHNAGTLVHTAPTRACAPRPRRHKHARALPRTLRTLIYLAIPHCFAFAAAAFSFASGSWSLAGGASCVPMHRDEDRRT